MASRMKLSRVSGATNWKRTSWRSRPRSWRRAKSKQPWSETSSWSLFTFLRRLCRSWRPNFVKRSGLLLGSTTRFQTSSAIPATCRRKTCRSWNTSLWSLLAPNVRVPAHHPNCGNATMTTRSALPAIRASPPARFAAAIAHVSSIFHCHDNSFDLNKFSR